MDKLDINNRRNNSNCTETGHKVDTTRGCVYYLDQDMTPSARATTGSHKLEIYDWLSSIYNPLAKNQVVEVRFKNTRKAYFYNNHALPLAKDDIVVVESSPGLDVGIVSLSGDLVSIHMRKLKFNSENEELRNIIRKATPEDIVNWQEAIASEFPTMIQSRQIATDLGLNMKIGDVEYQSDKLKAIFYYIADERVDFRELIKILADRFRIRVEMKQIGARQEAGRIGGIAACGRELCCSTWQNSFQSVTIDAARHQDISLNPQKLAGQCCKLKCCLNYEVDNYIDARKQLPRLDAPLEAKDGTYHMVKSDIFKGVLWFSTDPKSLMTSIPLGVSRVKEIIAMNRKGEKVDRLEDNTIVIPTQPEEPVYKNVVGEDSLTRFDSDQEGAQNRRRKRSSSTRTKRKERAVGESAPQSERKVEGSNRTTQSSRRHASNKEEGEGSAQNQRKRRTSRGTQQQRGRRTDGKQENSQSSGEKQIKREGEKQQPKQQAQSNEGSANLSTSDKRGGQRENRRRRPSGRTGKSGGENGTQE